LFVHAHLQGEHHAQLKVLTCVNDTVGHIVPSLNALTPAVNLPPVSMTPAAICQR
jgi:hypothetical protein